MKKIPTGRRLYENWSRDQFLKFKKCVAFIESEANGVKGIGSAFHVGEGVFVTARHVVEGRTITDIGFNDDEVTSQLVASTYYRNSETADDMEASRGDAHQLFSITSGPHFHPDDRIDVACFRLDLFPKEFIPLGGHLDDFLGQYELVLHRTLVLGYPRIPFSLDPVLVASLGEINALVDKYGTHGHPHFVVSTMARGGFSGGPALVAYNEDDVNRGTAALGMVTESLTENDQKSELGYMAVLTVEPIYDCLHHHKLLPACQEMEGVGW